MKAKRIAEILAQYRGKFSGKVAREGDLAYAIDKRRMDKIGIPHQSIKATSDAYTEAPVWSILFILIGLSLLHLFHNGGGLPFPITLGLLSKDKIKDLRWAILSRVSSNPQITNTSTGTQLDHLKQEVKRVAGRIIMELEVAESAATTKQDYLENLATAAENNEIDVIGVSKLDRLTRADPWESFAYLKRLKESGVILYAGTHGYFDWDDLYDFQLLVRQVVFSREWYERLRENAEEGQISKLQKGKWPFGKPPYGYTLDEGQNIYLTQEGRKIIPQIFDIYQETENMEGVKRQIEKKNDLEKPPSTSQIATLLTHRICIGELTLKEQVISRDSQLEIINRETFDQVQQILDDQGSSSASVPEIPSSIDEIARDVGLEYVIDQLGSLSKACRKCGGDVRKNGTKERWDTVIQNYVCKDCGYQAPLLNQAEFEKFHQTLPLQCPFCPATEKFEIKHTPHADYEYSYRCKQCEKQIGINTLPNKYERAVKNPELTIDWYSDPTRQLDHESSSDKSDIQNGSNQKALSEF